jgi:hypothetical protein
MQLMHTFVLKKVSLSHKTSFKGIQGRSFPLPPLQTVVNHALFTKVHAVLTLTSSALFHLALKMLWAERENLKSH